jgi:hypothetical protein
MSKITITIEGLTEVLKDVFGKSEQIVASTPEEAVEQTNIESAVQKPVGMEVFEDPESFKLPSNIPYSDGTPPAPPAPDQTVAPSAPPAPDQTVIPPAPAQTGVELDKNGCPWDVRINTSNKGKTAKGIWKRKPKLEDAFYLSIIEELKTAQAVPGPAPEQNVPTPDNTTVPGQTSITSFAELSNAILLNGKSNEEVNDAVIRVGLQSFALLGSRPDLVPAVAQNLGLL